MKDQEFSSGIRDGMPICLGYFSVSMAFGLTAALSGLPPWAATLMSVTNVTSAGQFAGANIIVVGGSLAELAVTTLIINLRYFLMSLSVSQKLSSAITLRQRLAISFGITDEIFAVSMLRTRELTAKYMAGLILMPVIGWTVGTATGAFATALLPQSVSNALGIALYGMFIALIIPPARKKRSVLAAVLLAIAVSCAFYYIPALSQLSGGFAIIITAVAVSALMATIRPIEQEGDQ